jgi:hypothetical protein
MPKNMKDNPIYITTALNSCIEIKAPAVTVINEAKIFKIVLASI